MKIDPRESYRKFDGIEITDEENVGRPNKTKAEVNPQPGSRDPGVVDPREMRPELDGIVEAERR